MENKKKAEEEDEKGSVGRCEANVSRTEMKKLMEANEFIYRALRCWQDRDKSFLRICTSPHSLFHLRSETKTHCDFICFTITDDKCLPLAVLLILVS